jgi:copper(I)-binding protein
MTVSAMAAAQRNCAAALRKSGAALRLAIAPARTVVLASLLALASPAHAGVTFADGWMRPAAAGAASAEAYIDVAADDALTLVGVTTPVAASVELVQGQVSAGEYRTNVVRQVAIAAKSTYRFARFGNVLRLSRLAQDVRSGDSVVLTFTFQDAAKRTSTASATIVARGVADPAPAK